jgi:hypothetical protein
LREDVPNLDARTLRQFAGLWTVIVGSVAVTNLYAYGNSRGGIVWGLVATIGIVGLLVPAVMRPGFLLALTITMPIGRVVSYLLLAVLFYVVLMPVGAIFRLIGRDALDRRIDTSASTYWVERPPSSDPRRYLNQS